MATRRARVKLAPNLGLSRNKIKAVCPKPKIVVKSDTDNSDAEPIADLDVNVRNVDAVPASTNNVEKVVNGVGAGFVEDRVNGANHCDESVSKVAQTINEDGDIMGVEVSSNCFDAASEALKMPRREETLMSPLLPLKSSVVVAISPGSLPALPDSNPTTVFDIVTNPVQTLPITAGNADEEASDWEDDQFTYKSVEVNENDEMYKSLEITPLYTSDGMNGNQTVEVTGLEKAFVVDTTHVQNPTSTPALSILTPPTTLTNSHGSKVRLPIGKNKFKPNLNFDRRSRNISGGSRPAVETSPRPSVPNGLPVARARAVSGSSTSSEPEIPPPRQSFSPSPSQVRGGVMSPGRVMSPKPARIKRNSEMRIAGDKSHFMRRKLDHKKKFMKGVPDRGSITMFDLIYYNPEYGQRMSVEDDKDGETVDNPDDPKDDTQQVPNGLDDIPAAEAVTPEHAAVVEEESIPVPQVKVGPNGEIILDEKSLQLETNDQKKAKDLLQNSPVVFESNKTSTNYGTWSKKRRHNDWSEKETIKFYKALSVVGSDFSMMESIFKNRTRQELKLKFKKEEKMNNKMIDKCLSERGMFTDLNGLMEDSEDEDDVVEKGRGRKAKKKRPRRRYVNRGYYSSSEGEDADVESSRSPARKKARESSQEEKQMVRIKRPQVMNRENARRREMIPPRAEAISLSDLAEQAKANGGITEVPAGLPGVQFPPGLLAANPVLGAAKPGSLVVVASPNKTDPSSQLLHVYMVSAKNKDRLDADKERLDTDRDRSESPRTVGSGGPKMPLDPAVVRAVSKPRVERARTMSESAGKGQDHRAWTGSEAEDKSESMIGSRARQRTYSESGLSVRKGEGSKDLDLRTETIRRRFLSGTARSSPVLTPPTLVAPSPPPSVLPKHTPLPFARKSKPVELLDS